MVKMATRGEPKRASARPPVAPALMRQSRDRVAQREGAMKKETTIAEQIKNLKKMKSAALREQFHKVTGKDAPSNDRAVLIKAIASALHKSATAKDEAEIAELGARAEAKSAAAKTKGEAKKARAAKKNEPKAAKSATKPAAPRAIDPRLPPVGTVLKKVDRHGAPRCEAIVEDGGRIRYNGTVYGSLSAAAMAAAKDLGGGGGSVNGWAFWGIVKPARAQRDPLVVLDRAWERYRGNVESLVKTGITDDNRSKVASAIKKHAAAIEALRDKVA